MAAHLSLGLPPHRLGDPHENLVDLDWPEPRIESRRIVGAVESIDSFGNLITNIAAELLCEQAGDHELTVVCRQREVRGIVRTYGLQPRSSLVVLFGSTGRLELAIVEGNAAQALSAAVGDSITVSW